MSAVRRGLLVAACAVGVALASCGDASEAPVAGNTARIDSGTATSRSTPALSSGTQFGTAGLIPRNYPTSGEADWIAMYESSDELGRLIGVYGDWTDAETAAGEIPTLFRAADAAAERFGSFEPLIGLGFANEDPMSGALTPTVDWADETEVARFTSVATGIASESRPTFMVIGGEINRLWEQHPATYEAFVAVWPSIYDAIKVAAPATEVGVGFQLEIMSGGGFLTGAEHAAHWQLLDGVREHLDFVAFSTYPYLDYESPEAIPPDYYAVAAAHAGLPVAFTELGWPSRPLSNFPESGYGGSAEEQAAFAARFLKLIDDLDVRFALWSFQHDIGTIGGPAFESVSLRENDGTPKPALEVWAAASD